MTLASMQPLLFGQQSWASLPLTRERIKEVLRLEGSYLIHDSGCTRSTPRHMHCQWRSCRTAIYEGEEVLLIFKGVFVKRRKLRAAFCSTSCQRRAAVAIMVRTKREDRSSATMRALAQKRMKNALAAGHGSKAFALARFYEFAHRGKSAKRFLRATKRGIERARTMGDLTAFRHLREELRKLQEAIRET